MNPTILLQKLNVSKLRDITELIPRELPQDIEEYAWDEKASLFDPEEEATRYDEYLRNLGCEF